MRKLISFMHVSLDGFVSGPSETMNWVIMDEEIFQDAIDMASVTGAALYGRVTYQMMESYWPSVLKNPTSDALELSHAKWVENIDKIVFSNTLDKAKWNNTRLIKNNIGEEVVKLKQQPGRDMVIFGSPTLTHSLMELDLIDEYKFNISPVILGDGVPLFANSNGRMELRLLSERKFKSGVISVHYKTSH